MKKSCDCGCGEIVNSGNFIRGHNLLKYRREHEPYLKGKSMEEVFGEKKAKIVRNKIKAARRKQVITSEHKERISQGLNKAYSSGKRKIKRGKKNHLYGVKGEKHPAFGNKHSEETKKIISKTSSERLKKRWKTRRGEMLKIAEKARENSITPKQDSSIELKIQGFLKDLGREFYTHVYMKNITSAYRCDIWIPSKNLVIECDGDYWHGNPKIYSTSQLSEKQKLQRIRDEERTSELKERGFQVLRMWGSEIRTFTIEEFKDILENYKVVDEGEILEVQV